MPGRPAIGPFFVAYALPTTPAVGVAVFAGAASGFLAGFTALMQWIPFAVVMALHGVIRHRRPRGVGLGPWSLWGAAATRVRGRVGVMCRASLLALCSLILVCIVPILVSGAAGLVSLRWDDGAATAFLLTPLVRNSPVLMSRENTPRASRSGLP